jgi:hypothetical protein
MAKCLNCGTESDGKYCPGCGQEVALKRLEAKTIFHDVTHGILHWENSILKTFKMMLLNPGGTSRDYISGQRKSVVKPFTYFIFIQTVYVLFFHRMSGQYFAFLNFSFKTADTMQGKIEQMQHVVNAYINYFNYFMPIFFALYFFLFYKKKTGVNYAESIALSFYWIGTTLVFGIFLMLLSLIDIRIWNLRFILNFIYLVFAVMQFTKMPKVKGMFKSILMIFLSYFTYAVFVSLILFIYFYFFTL